MRTTINIDPKVLRQLKRLQKAEGKPLGRLVSELIAEALVELRTPRAPVEFRWISRPMGARIDLENNVAVGRALENLRRRS